MRLRFPQRPHRLPELRWWGWAIVAGLLIGVVAGIAGHQKIDGAPYVSSSQVLVTGLFSDSQVDSALSAEQYVDQRMSTYAEIATSERVTGPAARALHTDSTTVANEISATVEGDTTVITLAVRGATPPQAATNARAVTRAFAAAITNLESVGGSSSRVALSVISNPTTPPDRDLPGLAVWIIGGMVLCAGLAVLIVLLVRWLFPKWQRAQRGTHLDAPAPHEPLIVRRAEDTPARTPVGPAPGVPASVGPASGVPASGVPAPGGSVGAAGDVPADPEPTEVLRTERTPEPAGTPGDPGKPGTDGKARTGARAEPGGRVSRKPAVRRKPTAETGATTDGTTGGGTRGGSASGARRPTGGGRGGRKTGGSGNSAGTRDGAEGAEGSVGESGAEDTREPVRGSAG